MATIDVSDLITDPDFADSFLVTRTAIYVDESGRVNKTPSVLAFIGVVQPASGQAQRLLPEGARAEGSITIYTIAPLQQVSSSFLSDTLVWNGATYTVQNVNDYSNWGAGYYTATCTLKDLVSTP